MEKPLSEERLSVRSPCKSSKREKKKTLAGQCAKKTTSNGLTRNGVLMEQRCSFWFEGHQSVRWPSNTDLKPRCTVKSVEPPVNGIMISHTAVLGLFYGTPGSSWIHKSTWRGQVALFTKCKCLSNKCFNKKITPKLTSKGPACWFQTDRINGMEAPQTLNQQKTCGVKKLFQRQNKMNSGM